MDVLKVVWNPDTGKFTVINEVDLQETFDHNQRLVLCKSLINWGQVGIELEQENKSQA